MKAALHQHAFDQAEANLPKRPPVALAAPDRCAILNGYMPVIYELLNQISVVIQEVQRETTLDVDELLALATILTANLQRWHRASGSRSADHREIELVPISQSALARSTNTPRQTMRRRLDRLVAIGAVQHGEDGLIVDFDNQTILTLLRHLPIALGVNGAATKANAN